MSGQDQKIGENLKAWRQRLGYSLENAAERIALAAEARGVGKDSKKVPRSYVSLSRWEKDAVEIKELGLSLIAEAYGVERDVLRRPPPPENATPKRSIDVPVDQADAVEAFLAALNRRA